MKPMVAMLTIVTAAGWCLAFAEPPAAPDDTPSRSAPAPGNSAADSTAAEVNAQSSAASTAPAPVAADSAAKASATASANATPNPSSERITQRLLRQQGYKLSMSNGEEMYCRREVPLGSHLPTVLHCITATEADAMAREGREVTEHLQHDMAGCLSNGSRGTICH